MIWRTDLENAWRSEDDLKNWSGKSMKMKMIWRTEEPNPKEEEERSKDDLKNRFGKRMKIRRRSEEPIWKTHEDEDNLKNRRTRFEGRRRTIWKTRVLKTRDAIFPYCFANITTNEIVKNLRPNGKKIPGFGFSLSLSVFLSQFFSLLFMVWFYHFCNFALNFFFFLDKW